jgi:hypothetical protein
VPEANEAAADQVAIERGCDLGLRPFSERITVAGGRGTQMLEQLTLAVEGVLVGIEGGGGQVPGPRSAC